MSVISPQSIAAIACRWLAWLLCPVVSLCPVMLLGGVAIAADPGSSGDGDLAATHWSLRPIDPTRVRRVDTVGQAAEVVDELIQQKLAQAGLAANDLASPPVQARRTHLDLTGLPPTPKQQRQFLDDRSPDAHQRMVDRLLASKHLGQHLGRYWLDRVRYADTHGLHLDNYREIWPYRDWVIAAINQNMPFNTFVTKQLAGDLLPDATNQDLVASGFNRLNLSTNEAGSIYEEVFARNCIDRTNAFGSVFLGLTLGCAACHDHKYDPISQEDYYSMLAFFNSLDGPALDQDIKNPPPSIHLPNDQQRRLLREYDYAIADVAEEKQAAMPSIDRAQQVWQQSLMGQSIERSIWIQTPPGQHAVVASLPPDVVWRAIRIQSSQQALTQWLGNVRVEIAEADFGDQWQQVPVTRTQQDGRIGWLITPSLYHQGTSAKVRVSWHRAMDVADLSLHLSEPPIPATDRVTVSSPHVLGPLEVESPSRGYDRTFGSEGKTFDPEQTFRYLDQPFRWQNRQDWRQFQTIQVPAIADRPSVSLVHLGIGSPGEQEVSLLLQTNSGYVIGLGDQQVANVNPSQHVSPRQPAASQQPPARFNRHTVRLRPGPNDLYIKLVSHHGDLQVKFALDSPLVAAPNWIKKIAATPMSQRTIKQRDAIRSYFRSVRCDHPRWQVLQDLESGLRLGKQKLLEQCATSLIWRETSQPRTTHVLENGRYDQPAQVVQRDTPGCLPPLEASDRADRLGLARWLTDPGHPLTARVAVNQFWQIIFGRGLVESGEDFGTQGTAPSHPELLDFLAWDFIRHGWDVKRLLKILVMTDTYRRSARVTPLMQTRDPLNRWLARGPRYRLDAEVLRDQALSLSGRLNDELGGPPVKVPQPDGLWHAVGYPDSNTARFRADQGDQILRRSVYLFWKRTSPPPQLALFDAPSREVCTAGRQRTNTPAQALVLLNEPQQLEAARHLARRFDTTDDARTQLSRLFRHVTTRDPDGDELDQLYQLLLDLMDYYRSSEKLAIDLVGHDDAGLAAWTVIASTCLNLDDVINK